jgi:hypothetical protein
MNQRLFRVWRRGTSLSHLALAVLLGAGGFAQAAIDTHYVATNGLHQTPFTNGWASAATNIQAAIDAAGVGDTVRVRAGVYDAGERVPVASIGGKAMTSSARVVVDKAIILRSESGDPAGTIIRGTWNAVSTNGPGAVRCIYLAASSSLIGFTLTHGATVTNTATGCYWDTAGGGVLAFNLTPVISNCVITGNAAGFNGGGGYNGKYVDCLFTENMQWAATDAAGGGGVRNATLYQCTLTRNFANGKEGGGGANSAMLYNCLLTGNQSRQRGGGTDTSDLRNCTVARNSSQNGGGVSYGTLHNCIVQENYSSINTTLSNWAYLGSSAARWTTNSCLTPVTGLVGAGNITNAPMFFASGSGYGLSNQPGNYRLTRGSPCIDKGVRQTWMNSARDLDGQKRISGTSVDLGAYEFIQRLGTLIGIR